MWLAEPTYNFRYILGTGFLAFAVAALLALRADWDLPKHRWRHALPLTVSLFGFALTQVTTTVALTAFLVVGWVFMVLDSYLADRRRSAPPRTGLGLLATGLVAFALFGTTVHQTQVATPSPPIPLHRQLVVEGGTPKSEIYGLTVFNYYDVPWALWWASGNSELMERRDLNEWTQDVQAYDARLVYMMQNASLTASAIAQEQANLGQGIRLRTQGMVISYIHGSSPVSGSLAPGDVISRVNGLMVDSWDTYAAIMAQTTPGQEITLDFERAGARGTLTVTLVNSPEQPDRGFLGLLLEPLYDFDRPRQVTLLNDSISGSSMGAALFLAVLDQLSTEPITFGNRVAVTGTIEVDGAIGQVGGVPQKGYTAELLQVDVLFVPVGQGTEARRLAPSIQIVEVGHYREMLDWLMAYAKL